MNYYINKSESHSDHMTIKRNSFGKLFWHENRELEPHFFEYWNSIVPKEKKSFGNWRFMRSRPSCFYFQELLY